MSPSKVRRSARGCRPTAAANRPADDDAIRSSFMVLDGRSEWLGREYMSGHPRTQSSRSEPSDVHQGACRRRDAPGSRGLVRRATDGRRRVGSARVGSGIRQTGVGGHTDGHRRIASRGARALRGRARRLAGRDRARRVGEPIFPMAAPGHPPERTRATGAPPMPIPLSASSSRHRRRSAGASRASSTTRSARRSSPIRFDLESLRREPRRLIGRRRLAASLALVDQAMAAVRDFALELRPPVLDDLGLIAATRWYARRQAEARGLPRDRCLRTRRRRTSPPRSKPPASGCSRRPWTTSSVIARRPASAWSWPGWTTPWCSPWSDNGVGFDPARAVPSAGSALGLHGHARADEHSRWLAGGHRRGRTAA